MFSEFKPPVLSAGKRELVLTQPLLCAAGFAGFSREAEETIDFNHLGALITNPISLRPRSPARNAGVRRVPGGFLLHSGLPNDGLEATIRRHQQRWQELPCPVIAHIISDSPDQLERMLLRLEAQAVIAAVEIGLETAALVEACAAVAARAELPVILRLPLDSGAEAFMRAADAGAPALSMGPPRGASDRDGQTFSGRLYGPSLLPLALQLTQQLGSALAVPLIAAGGVGSRRDAQRLLQVGAAAVQLDYALWLHPLGEL